MKLDMSDTALVVIDPQNDVLSEKGISWPVVVESVKENHTIENLTRLFQTAKDQRLRSLHLAPLSLSSRPVVGIRRTGGKSDAR